ncbi:MAG: tetratricopeptide repeat protein [Elusimicrobia bacterium]|nr:tetratricopeptide repeat protein [Elusimicrobiota bacterium]
MLDHHADDEFPNMMEAAGYFKEGRKAYQAGRWDQAAKLFHEVLRLHPKDKLSRLYVDRCERLKADPPGDRWNGVWVMTDK